MLKLVTERFGEIMVGEEDLLHFERGIPGLPDMRRVCLLRREEDEPIRWLVDVDDATVAIPVVGAGHIAPGYFEDLAAQVKGLAGAKDTDELELYVILVIGSDPARVTANLRAPILVDRRAGTATQLVLPSEEYPIRYRLFPGNDLEAGEGVSANSG